MLLSSMSKIVSSCGTVKCDHQVWLSPLVADLYSAYNHNVVVPDYGLKELEEMELLVCSKLGMVHDPKVIKSLDEVTFPVVNSDEKAIVLGFSVGLDSVFQAIDLMERGYRVILYHLKNINTYENGQATKQCPVIAEKLGMEYVESVINKRRGEQEVPENPFKNELILALMIDYALENDIQCVSLGDDLNLSLADAAVGINVTDAHEVTESFFRGLANHVSIRFLPIMDHAEKLDRIKKLMEYGLENDYYSCVQSGRFNASLHHKAQEKYHIELFDHNCGCYCRKCAMHNLLMHYGGVKTFPQDFVDACWKILWKNSHSADYVFFRPDLPLEERIRNLFTY